MSGNFNFPLVRVSNFSLAIAALLLGSLSLQPAVAADKDFGVVDMNEAVKQLMVISGLKDRLEDKKAKLQRQLQAAADKAESAREDMQKDELNLTPIQMRRRNREVVRMQNEAQLMQRQYQEELEQYEQEEMLLLRKELGNIIGDIVKKKKFELVFYAESLAGFKAKYDITDDVIEDAREEYSSKSKKKK